LIGGISKWEIAVTVKFFGSLSYSYYFSVVAETTMDVAVVAVAIQIVVANFLFYLS